MLAHKGQVTGWAYHVLHTELKRHRVVHHQLNFAHISLNPLEIYNTEKAACVSGARAPFTGLQLCETAVGMTLILR
jgi:hypothetical protein